MILAVAVTRPRGHEHHVRALEVPMDQPDPVGGGERRGNLLHDRQSLRQQPHGQTEHVGFRLRGRSPGVADEVEDPANVGMGDLPRELELSVEALGGLAPALRVRPYGLERDAHAQLEILGFVHLPHAAAGDEPGDAIAAGDQLVPGEGGGSVSAGARGGGHVIRRADSVRRGGRSGRDAIADGGATAARRGGSGRAVGCSRGRLVGRGWHGRALSGGARKRVDYATRIRHFSDALVLRERASRSATPAPRGGRRCRVLP
jgi:hypothetical protein